MRFEGRQKVHIASVGFEIDRVVGPIKKIGADKIVLITNIKESGVYREYIDEVKRQLGEVVRKENILERPLNIFDFNVLMSGICSLIKEENEKKNYVFVNVSVGTRLFGAASMISSLMYGATPYYADVKEYRTHVEDFYEDGKPVGISKGVKEIYEIPFFKIQPPREDLIITLLKISEHKAGISQSRLIKILESIALMEDVTDRYNKVSKKALAAFRRKYLDPLIMEGWVEKIGRRRSARLHITDSGKNTLEIFRDVYIK